MRASRCISAPSNLASRSCSSPCGLDFKYGDFFELKPSTGYETLLYDVLIGDPTLFNRADNIEAGWQAVQPILDAMGKAASRIQPYPAGSDGPAEADALLSLDGHRWRKLGLVSIELVVSDVDDWAATIGRLALPCFTC